MSNSGTASVEGRLIKTLVLSRTDLFWAGSALHCCILSSLILISCEKSQISAEHDSSTNQTMHWLDQFALHCCQHIEIHLNSRISLLQRFPPPDHSSPQIQIKFSFMFIKTQATTIKQIGHILEIVIPSFMILLLNFWLIFEQVVTICNILIQPNKCHTRQTQQQHYNF